jgi:PAS domain-containing protein
MYKTVFEKASFGLALVNLSDGSFIDANPRFCEIIHREMDQLIGKQWPVIAGISDRELVKAQIRDFQETTNKSLCCDLSITIDFEDEQGRDVALISIHDMTEIKAANLRAKWSSDQLEAVLDAVPAAI